MKTTDLFLRCYAEKQDGLWVAVCIDLCLGAQDRDPRIAMQKLHEQIADHLDDAFSSPEYRSQMLSRKAPLSLVLKYHFIRLRCTLNRFLDSNGSAQGSEKVFCEAMPLKLA